MNQPHTLAIEDAEGEIKFSDAADCLHEITQPAMALTVWRRELDHRLTDWLDALSPDALPHKRFVAPRLSVAGAVETACAALPDCREKTSLIKDIADLADRFSVIMSAPMLRIRLEAIEGNACRRFHQDAVEARLLCTYRGPATEYGYADQGETPKEIHALRRGDAAICKGSAWPEGPTHKLLHRSPPIAGTGQSRLLLVVDPAAPAEDQDWAAHLRPRATD